MKCVQTSGRPQNWNRYTYALNNPQKFLDPDGEHPLIAAAVGGAIVGGLFGGGLELASQLISGKEVNWQKVGSKALAGAIFGAAAGLTGGLSAVQAGGVVAGGSVLGGIAGRAVDGDDTTSAGDVRSIAIDAVSGFGGGYIGSKALEFARRNVPSFILNRRATAYADWEVLLGTPMEIKTIQGPILRHALSYYGDSTLWEKPIAGILRGGVRAGLMGSIGALWPNANSGSESGSKSRQKWTVTSTYKINTDEYNVPRFLDH